MPKKERWRPVVGIEGYEVSDQGRVRSLKYSVPMVMNTHDTRQGYVRVILRSDGRNLGRTVHSLVLEAFVGPRPKRHVCEWKNRRIWDNRLSNLKWSTRSESKCMLRPYKAPTTAKLTERQVLEIYFSNERGVDLAEKYGVGATAISRIRKGKTWKHVTGG